MVYLMLLAAMAAFGQPTIDSNLMWSDGVRVVVVNDTADQRICRIEVDGRYVGNVHPGQTVPVFRYNGLWIVSTTGYQRQLSITAKVCREAKEVQNFYAAPSWVLDERIVGSKADLLADAFLRANPPEQEVKKRVEQLKKLLDERKLMGRGELKRQVDTWYGFVKSNGVERTEIQCEDPVAVSTTVYVYGNTYERSRTSTLFLRGSKGQYSLYAQ